MRKPSLRAFVGAPTFWAIGILGLMVVAVIAGAVFMTSIGMDQIRDDIEMRRSRSLEAIVSANRVESVVIDRQRIMRGYILTNGRLGLDDIEASRGLGAATALRGLVSGDRVQVERAKRLFELVRSQEQRISAAKQAIAEGRIEEVREVVSNGIGEKGISDVRGVVDRIVQRERNRLDGMRREAIALNDRTEHYTYGIGLIGLLIVVFGGTSMMMALNTSWRDRVSAVEARAEAAIRRRMRIAHEATGAGTWENDGGRPVWGPEMYRLYGLVEAEGMPDRETWAGMVHPDDIRDCPWASWNALGSTSFERTFRIGTASGGWRWIVSRGFSFEEGGEIKSVGMDVDVTEQVSNREELARLNEILSNEAEESRRDKELVFEAAGDLMAVIGEDGRLRSVNPAWTRVLGTDVHDAVGRDMSSFMAGGETWQGVCQNSSQMTARDGSLRTVEWSVAQGPNGVLIAAGRDVTAQREAEVRLRAAEDAVRQMQKIETVGQMTGGIAHDFNNMLTPIIGFLDLLARRHASDEKSSKMINMAQQSADRAKTLVSKLLSFARRQQLDAKVVDVCGLVGGMNELVEKSVAGSGVEVSFTHDGHPRCVKVDANQFEMVVLNLAVNARDAMPQGGRIRVDVRRSGDTPLPDGLAEGPYVIVEVSDDGIGMEPDVLARAVEPFYSTKGAGKGTGLGLSMAHGMAAQSGGTLVLRSRPGVGTSASIWLPEVESCLLPAAEDSGGGVVETTRRLKVLLVDDEDLVRKSIEEMLVALGHEVVTASSGAQAMAIFASEDAFDVLVTDYLMPTMTGVELVGRIRELHAGMPAVIVSGYTALKDQDRIEGTVRMSKPFNSQRLSESLAKVVPAARATGTVVEMRRRS